MSTQTISTLENILVAASDSLSISLDSYWPTIGDNEMGERNTTLHLGHAFLLNGFKVFNEVTYLESSTQGKSQLIHLDLLSIHPTEKIVVAVESKRLYGGEKAGEMFVDESRLDRFHLSKSNMNLAFEEYHYFGILISTGWQEKISQWWAQETHSTLPAKCTSKNWSLLGAILDRKQAVSSTVSLDHSHPLWRNTHELLYVIIDYGLRTPEL